MALSPSQFAREEARWKEDAGRKHNLSPEATESTRAFPVLGLPGMNHQRTPPDTEDDFLHEKKNSPLVGSSFAVLCKLIYQAPEHYSDALRIHRFFSCS